MTSNISGYNQVVSNFQSTLKLDKGEDVVKYMHSKNSGLSDWLLVLARRVGHLFTSGVWINESRILKEVGDLRAVKEQDNFPVKIKDVKAINELFLGKKIEGKIQKKTFLKVNSDDLSSVINEINDSDVKLTVKLDSKVSIIVNCNSISFKLKLSEADLPKLTELEKASGQKVTANSNVSSKIGKAFFDWAKTQDFGKNEEQLKSEYSYRAGMFVKDIQALLVSKGFSLPSDVKISGVYSKYMKNLTKYNLPKYLHFQIAINDDLNVNFALKAGDKEKPSLNAKLIDIVGTKFRLKHLSAATGHEVYSDTDINNLVGYSYWKWATDSGFKEEDIIAGHKARVKALEQDMKSLGAYVTIQNDIDYDKQFKINGNKVMVVSLCEGMGNQMFQSASAYALAKDTGVDFYCVQKKGIDHQNKLPEVMKKLPMKDNAKLPLLPFMNVWGKNVMDEFPKDKTRSWLIEGHLQSPDNFDHHRKDILELFSPSTETVEKLKTKYPEVTKPKTIALHIRRGDYLKTDANGKLFFHNLLDEWKYYEQALEAIGTEDAHVFIFSNDLPYCKNHAAFKKLKNVTFVDGGTPSDDIYLMSLCQNHVISNGTFAWWGAYLSEQENKKVFYPNKWIGPAWGDYVPKGLPHKSWTMIDCQKKL